MKKKEYINKVFDSNNYGKFVVLEEIYMDSYDRMYLVEFLDTGYRTICSRPAINKGTVKDKFFKSVANIGYIGADIKITDPLYYNLYKVWNDMINRCYNCHDIDYKYYGAIGVSVDEHWHSFYNFYLDAINLPGYINKLNDPLNYQLDKDYLQMNIPKSNRIYSKYTCIWINKIDNTIIMNRDKDTKLGYYGVIYRDGYYRTRINNKTYGKFKDPKHAACLFNYIYPIYNKETDICIRNDVEMIPLLELLIEKCVI